MGRESADPGLSPRPDQVLSFADISQERHSHI